jgi:transposase
MLPVVGRTWAVRGQTPVLTHNAKRLRRVSAVGMLSVSPRRRRLGCYYLLTPEASIDETIAVAVLKALRRHFRGPVIVLWDRLQAHRSAHLRRYLASVQNLEVEYFPAYAPELNPVEYLWSDAKLHDLAQFCPNTLDQLAAATDRALAAKRNDQRRIAGYIRQARLPLRIPNAKARLST